MSLTLTSESRLRLRVSALEGNLTAVPSAFLILLTTLGAVAADQFAAPALYSSSPLWATAACLMLVWRRDGVGFRAEAASEGRFSFPRIALFGAAHILLVSATLFLHGVFEPANGSVSARGWAIAALKLSVLLPTIILVPLARWRILAHTYAAEGVAALLVLFTFFPGRILSAVWPWYGQLLGRLVFSFSQLFVPGLTYTSAFSPTLGGPHLDVTILLACSGISGIELFDYLFAFMAILDWNRLRKGRTLMAYLGGIAAMFLGNALRIASFVIVGNHGFAGVVARFHLSAGWIFFSALFLVYLSFTHPKLLVNPS